MQGADDQVAGLGRLHAQLDGLAVAHLADQDDLGGLAQGGAQAVGKSVEVAAELPLVEGGLDIGMDELDGDLPA